eukprot:582030_1
MNFIFAILSASAIYMTIACDHTEVDDCGQCLQPNDPEFNNCCNGDVTKGYNECGLCLLKDSYNFNHRGKDCNGTCFGLYSVDICGECLLRTDAKFDNCTASPTTAIPTAIPTTARPTYPSPTAEPSTQTFSPTSTTGSPTAESSAPTSTTATPTSTTGSPTAEPSAPTSTTFSFVCSEEFKELCGETQHPSRGWCDYDFELDKPKCSCDYNHGWYGLHCEHTLAPTMRTAAPTMRTSAPTRNTSQTIQDAINFEITSTLNDDMVHTNNEHKMDSQSSRLQDNLLYVLIGGVFVCCVFSCCAVFVYSYCKKPYQQMQRVLDRLDAQNYDIELADTEGKQKRIQLGEPGKDSNKYEMFADHD